MRTITLSQLVAEFGQIRQRAKDLTPVMRAGSIMGLSEVRERFNKSQGPDGTPWAPLAHPRPEGGTLPLLNHGTLRASYVNDYGADFWRVGTNLIKARLHHFGGTVTPRKGKFLAIPLTVQAVRSGGPRRMGGLSPRIKGARGVLADRSGRAQFALVKSVRIPARPQVGVSDELFRRFTTLLVHYLRTGSI